MVGVRTRRWGRIGACLLAAVLALAGCGSPAPTAPGPAGEGFPVTVSTAFGDVTVPSRPKRVVALGWGDAEVALMLGVQPVGAADWLPVGGDGVPPWVPPDERYATPPTMLGTTEVNLEAVAALRPDLILDTRASGDRNRYEKLSALGAPVVSIPPGGQSYRTSWQQQLELVGRALGRSAEAARVRDDLDARFRRAAAEHPEFAGRTAVVGSKTAGGYGAYVNGDTRVEFLQRLGFRQSPAVQQHAGSGFSLPISPERTDLLDADVTVMTPIGVPAEAITGDPLFRAVRSVRDGRSVVLSDPAVALAFASGTPGGLAYALDEVVPRLARVVAG